LNEATGRSTSAAPLSDVEVITDAAQQDLRQMEGARLFITGGTGYIGRWLLESICHANWVLKLQMSVTVLSRRPKVFIDRFPHLALDPAVTLVEGDVRNFDVGSDSFTHVVHAATDVIAESSALDMFDVTVAGTRNVLEFSRTHGVRNVLLLSSGAVYGSRPESPERISEATPCVADVSDPRNAYALGKITTEWLGNTYGLQYGLNCTSARVFAQLGPYLELGAHFAAGNFIRDALSGDEILIKGDGTTSRSYMYSTDLVTWLWAILNRGVPGRAYNVGSEFAVSIRELAQMVARAAGVEEARIKVLGRPVRGVAPARYVPDTETIREELGVKLTVPLEDALSRTLVWHQNQMRLSL